MYRFSEPVRIFETQEVETQPDMKIGVMNVHENDYLVVSTNVGVSEFSISIRIKSLKWSSTVMTNAILVDLIR